jgi:hypothetical protein
MTSRPQDQHKHKHQTQNPYTHNQPIHPTHTPKKGHSRACSGWLFIGVNYQEVHEDVLS